MTWHMVTENINGRSRKNSLPKKARYLSKIKSTAFEQSAQNDEKANKRIINYAILFKICYHANNKEYFFAF